MASLLEDKEKILGLICSKTGKTREEVEGLIAKKKEKFAGLLTDEGAAFMIAKELGIAVDAEEQVQETAKISELEDGMNGVDLKARVLRVYAPKSFESGGKKGKLVKILLGDESGEIPLTLWHKDVEWMDKQKIGRNSVLQLRNSFVSSFKGEKQLGLGFNGGIDVLDEEMAGSLPKAKSHALKVKDLEEKMDQVDIIARLLRVQPIKEFEKDGRKGKVTGFEVGDETGTVRGSAWNELAEQVNKLAVGKIVKIEGAYTKKGLQGTELQLSWRGRIIVEPPISFSLPELNELLKDAKIEAKEKKIGELREGENRVEVKGKIVKLFDRNPYYFSCGKCRGTLEKAGENFVCPSCGEVTEPVMNAVASVELDDGSGSIRAVGFKENAEKMLGVSEGELKKLVDEKPEDVVAELKKKIEGKELKVQGYVKKSSFNQELELIAREVK